MHIITIESSTWDVLSAAERLHRASAEITALWWGAHTRDGHVIEDSPNIAALRSALVVQTEHVDFERRDGRGRSIGAVIITWQHELFVTPSSRAIRYFARAQATRGRREFGASHGVREFASAEERATWRAKYLATGAKRAAR